MAILPLEDEHSARRWWEWLLGVLVVLACAGWVAWRLHVVNVSLSPLRVSSLVLRDTTANGGDMGAHVYWPWFLEHQWFPRLRLAGWSPDWYSGFPIGQYYFPFPAVLTAALDLILPYNVAFKLVTVLGAVLLPVAAYHLAEQLELPWPASPLWAVAALYYEFELRTHGVNNNTWTIYGGNLASGLAGEYSFTLGLTLALFFLATLAFTLRTGRRPWLPAVLLTACVTSHIVVAVFAAFSGVLIWLLHRPGRTWRIALPMGVVAFLLTAVWVVPLVATNSYTSSMRYEKKPVSSDGNWVFGFPWWIWTMLAAAVIGAGFWRRRQIVLPLVWAITFGLAFWLWPQDLAIWNTRWIPFYFLAIALLVALGVAELIRLGGYLVAAATEWVAEGDRLDRLDAYYAERAEPSESDEASESSERPERRATADVGATTAEPAGDGTPDPFGDGTLGAAWQPEPLPHYLSPPSGRERRRRRSLAMAVTIAVITAVVGVLGGWRADAQGGSIASGWSQWNYSGYEAKGAAWTEYANLMRQMGTLPCGRVLWEPSSGEPDAINTYGTSLALELLPYWTRGCIGSQEGLYFEASATKDAHFLTVSELAQHPSDPVRGLSYGTTSDFTRGVQHAQMLGVRYLMFWTPESQQLADQNSDLKAVLSAPDDELWRNHFQQSATTAERSAPATGWKVYEIRDWSLVEGLSVQPVVARLHAGTKSTCFGTPADALDTRLNAWECATDPWWMDTTRLEQPFAESGPDAWPRVDAARIGKPGRHGQGFSSVHITPARVTDAHESVDSISFHVDTIGKPVVVKSSFFPNWTVSGARGPYRLAPNLMVVVPTRHDVKLSYGVTHAEWLGRILTLLGLVLLVLLAKRFRIRPEWTSSWSPEPAESPDSPLSHAPAALAATAGAADSTGLVPAMEATSTGAGSPSDADDVGAEPPPNGGRPQEDTAVP